MALFSLGLIARLSVLPGWREDGDRSKGFFQKDPSRQYFFFIFLLFPPTGVLYFSKHTQVNSYGHAVQYSSH